VLLKDLQKGRNAIKSAKSYNDITTYILVVTKTWPYVYMEVIGLNYPYSS
jgi:hypothetical protein